MQPEFLPWFLLPWLHNISSNLLVHTFTHFNIKFTIPWNQNILFMISKNVSPTAIAFSPKLKKLTVFPTTDVGERGGLVLWRTMQWVWWVEMIWGLSSAVQARDWWHLCGAASPLGPRWGNLEDGQAATFAWEVMALDVLVLTFSRLGSP